MQFTNSRRGMGSAGMRSEEGKSNNPYLIRKGSVLTLSSSSISQSGAYPYNCLLSTEKIKGLGISGKWIKQPPEMFLYIASWLHTGRE